MNKNETIQIKLDEEQVQDVIGGCGVCRMLDRDIRHGDIRVATVTTNMINEIKSGKYAEAAILALSRQNNLERLDRLKERKEIVKSTYPGPHT